MGNRALASEPKRMRASQTAIRATLQALKASGVPVDRVCVIGGQVEIHCGAVEGENSTDKDGGLKQW
ncbi:hypothetical protein FKO01_25250 [Mesorhizobium sp. B2-3-3]|nr:hypothetical protein FKO01_25250 [Mesorhizobium sp. B2-3-3]